MIFRCPNIKELDNRAVKVLNFGTQKITNFNLGQMENLLFIGVPIFKHIACSHIMK